MNSEQLLIDLATAEINVKNKLKEYSYNFFEEVRKAFIKHDVQSYSDLIDVNVDQALKLRMLAVREKLL